MSALVTSLTLCAGVVVGLGGLRAWLIRAFRIRDRIPVTTPDALGLMPERARVPGVRGKTLEALLFLPHPGRPVVVVVHGWGASASHMLVLVPPVLKAGLNAVLFDARGHGGSDDDTFASLPRFAEDTEAVLAFLRRRDLGPLVLLGHSVGAGAVLLCASRDAEVAAVVSLAAFSHPRPIMEAWMAAYRIPRWPFWPLILAVVQASIGFRFDTIAPVTTAPRVRAPLLLVHGDSDPTVPPWHAEVLARAVPHARVLRLPGVGHDDPEGFSRHEDEILAWIHAALGGPAGNEEPGEAAPAQPALHPDRPPLH